MIKEKIILFFFIIGIILIGINLSSFFLPSRSPEVYELNQGTKMGASLSYQEVSDIIQNTSVPRKQYLININHAVNQGMATYWGNGNIAMMDKYLLRVPVYENYILFIMSYIMPDNFLPYEYTQYNKALKRGIGMCDQQTIALDGILKSQNIESKMIDTPHHFFETALADPATNEWWILDPDYGVVVPYDIQQITDNPELVRPFYLNEGYSNKTIDHLVDNVYQNHNIKIHPDISEYSTKLYPFERLSYVFIWLIPLVCILPFTIGILHKAVRRYRRKKP